jgi:hypothetical protein
MFVNTFFKNNINIINEVIKKINITIIIMNNIDFNINLNLTYLSKLVLL